MAAPIIGLKETSPTSAANLVNVMGTKTLKTPIGSQRFDLPSAAMVDHGGLASKDGVKNYIRSVAEKLPYSRAGAKRAVSPPMTLAEAEDPGEWQKTMPDADKSWLADQSNFDALLEAELEAAKAPSHEKVPVIDRL